MAKGRTVWTGSRIDDPPYTNIGARHRGTMWRSDSHLRQGATQKVLSDALKLRDVIKEAVSGVFL